VTVVTECS